MYFAAFFFFFPSGKAKNCPQPRAQLSETPLKEQVRQEWRQEGARIRVSVEVIDFFQAVDTFLGLKPKVG